MAAFVAATKLESTTGNNCSGSIASPTAGDALFCCMAADGVSASGTVTISDTRNTWANDAHGLTSGGAGNEGDLSISSAPNVLGGATTVTAKNTAASFGTSCSVMEFSGMATSSIDDASSPAIKTGTTVVNVATAVASNGLSNVTTNALYIGFLGTDESNTTAVFSGTTAGFTYSGGTSDGHGDGMTELDGTNYSVWNACYGLVSSVASRTANWNYTSTSTGFTDWGALIAVYKQASAGGVNPPPRRTLTGAGI